MRNTTKHTTIARSGLALAAIPLILIGLAACSSNDDASKKDPSSMSESQKKAAAHEFDLATAKCLRDKGFDSPDPDANGGGTALSLKDGQDPTAVFAAAKDCQKSTEEKLGKRPVTAAEQKMNDEGTKKNEQQNACLKEKGYDIAAAAGGGAADGASISVGPGSDIPEDVLEACGISTGSSGSTSGNH